MITKEQCRAARSFLGLKQAELADDCGLSKTAITHFESGLFNPRADNMANIVSALEGRGIEFVGNYGVQKRQTLFRMLEGDAMHLDLWDDVFDTMKRTGGEVLISYVDERPIFKAYPEELMAHLKRLKEHNITERILGCEGDTFFVQDQECYRWLPKDVFKGGVMTLVYGGKVAIQFWNNKLCLIIENQNIYQDEKERFEYLWEGATIPPSDEKVKN